MKYSIAENYEKLPEELRRQLTTLDDLGMQILKLLKGEGTLTIDNILIGLFLEYKKVSTHDKIEKSIQQLLTIGEINSRKGSYYISKKVVKKVRTE